MQVKFFATFRKITGEKEVQITGAGSVATLFAMLAARYSLAAEDNFLWRAGKIHPDVIVLVNGRAIEHLNGVATTLQETDTVAIFPRIAGG